MNTVPLTKNEKAVLDELAVAAIEIKYLMPLSTFVLSDEDFRHLKERERAIALNIEKDGIPL